MKRTALDFMSIVKEKVKNVLCRFGYSSIANLVLLRSYASEMETKVKRVSPLVFSDTTIGQTGYSRDMFHGDHMFPAKMA